MAELLQVSMAAPDLDRSAEFYGLLLGEEPAATFDPPGLVFFLVCGVRLLLSRQGESSTVYVKVDRLEEAIERLPQGTELVSAPHAIFKHEDGVLGPAGTEEWQAFVRDPAGNLVGLVELRSA